MRQLLAESGTHEFVDMLIKGLQCYMQGKPALVAGSRIGGANGEKLSRYAFAVMVKFAGLADKLQLLID